jgi:hypothetical protein
MLLRAAHHGAPQAQGPTHHHHSLGRAVHTPVLVDPRPARPSVGSGSGTCLSGERAARSRGCGPRGVRWTAWTSDHGPRDRARGSTFFHYTTQARGSGIHTGLTPVVTVQITLPSHATPLHTCLTWTSSTEPRRWPRQPMHTASCQRRLGKELLPPSPTNLPRSHRQRCTSARRTLSPPRRSSAHHGAPQPTTALFRPPRRSSAHLVNHGLRLNDRLARQVANRQAAP